MNVESLLHISTTCTKYGTNNIQCHIAKKLKNTYTVPTRFNCTYRPGNICKIELILEEASAWNVRKEVTQKAEKYIKSGHDPVDAYHFAYEDCTQQ